MGRTRPRVLMRLVVAVLAVAIVVAVVTVVRDPSHEHTSSRVRLTGTMPGAGELSEPSRPIPTRRSPAERAAIAAGRHFLQGFLPYSYGRGPASRIVSAAPPLRDRLRRALPRVPAEHRALQPRVVELEVTSSIGDLGVDLAAVIDDGRRRYSMVVAVRPTDGRWLVTAVS